MIKNFDQFLFESQDEDTRLVDFFAALTRNYESKRPFYTDLLQFKIEEERKEWRSTREIVELEKPVTVEASYKLKFILDEKMNILKLNFTFFILGQVEKDAPEALADEDKGRLNIVLEKVILNKIDLKTTDFDIQKSKKELSEPVRKASEAFLVKMMEDSYDSLGAEIYKIEY
jgi:hypothetical protein